jgi:hypothetical protein
MLPRTFAVEERGGDLCISYRLRIRSLLAYVLSRIHPALQTATFPISCVLTGLTLFTLGALDEDLY